MSEMEAEATRSALSLLLISRPHSRICSTKNTYAGNACKVQNQVGLTRTRVEHKGCSNTHLLGLQARQEDVEQRRELEVWLHDIARTHGELAQGAESDLEE